MKRSVAALAAVVVLAVAVPGPGAVASRTTGGVPVVDGAGRTGSPGAPAAADLSGADPGGAAPAAGSRRSPVTMPNTTAKLLLPGGGQPGAGATGSDLGAAVALDRRTTVARLGSVALERRFESADDDEEREAVVRGALDRIENRTRELRSVESRAYREYADGERSLRSLLLTLAAVDARARRYRSRLRRLADLAAGVPDVALQTRRGGRFIGRAGGIDKQLEMLTGPVRRHVARSYRATAEGGVVYVAAAEEGVVLSAMVDDGTYAREGLRADRIEPGPGQPILPSRVANETYPWVWDHQLVNSDLRGYPSIGVWRFFLGHTQGQLLAFVDRGSEAVVREVQWLRPERLPNRSTTAEGDGLEVTVNRTFPGGPLKVTVVDNVTGRPVGSIVTVGSHHLGPTGPDGELWTVAPRGATAVTVRQGPNQVNVTVPATEFRSVERAGSRGVDVPAAEG